MVISNQKVWIVGAPSHSAKQYHHLFLFLLFATIKIFADSTSTVFLQFRNSSTQSYNPLSNTTAFVSVVLSIAVFVYFIGFYTVGISNFDGFDYLCRTSSIFLVWKRARVGSGVRISFRTFRSSIGRRDLLSFRIISTDRVGLGIHSCSRTLNSRRSRNLLFFHIISTHNRLLFRGKSKYAHRLLHLFHGQFLHRLDNRLHHHFCKVCHIHK
mmetsp:Transcript_26787/g.55919  ORF Transcript_26787/g.55919 Transcript_26787/m.55919 type:complete len:212 (-) Transcript_26787:541-1176(-)